MARPASEHPSGEGKLIPARPRERAASFLQRLQGRFKREVDPEISLQEDESLIGERAERSESQGLFLKLSEKDPAASRYRIKGEVARGGMGAILRVWDDDLRRNLAMKVLLSRSSGEGSQTGETKIDEELLSRFLEEAQITGQLDHPGVVPVHELGIDGEGRIYFTMRLVRGRDLKQILDLLALGQEGWTLTKALHVMLKVCEAMAFAHSKGVVHRDLKPANIMVGRFGETYVMDWGLARVLGRRDSHDLRIKPSDASALSLVRTARKADQTSHPQSPLVTMDGDVIGTPSYMSPEQAEGKLEEVGPRSDVYSLGSILYQMLSGEAPYVKAGTQMTPHTVLLRALEGPPTPLAKLSPGVPDELVAICEKAMARAPGERYGSMLDLAGDIEAFLEGRVVSAYETGSLAEARKWIQRNRGMGAALAVALLLAIGGIAGVIAVQVTKASQLELANTDLASAKHRAEEKEADAIAAKATAQKAALEAESAREAANQSAAEAMDNERMARQRSYNSNILAAEYSLRLREIGEARTLLESCDEDWRDWEWRHLALRLQGQLGQPRNLTTPIGRVVLTPRGDRAVALTASGRLYVFDCGRSGLSEAPVLSGSAWVVASSLSQRHVDLDLSPDGTLLAVVGCKPYAVTLLSAEGLAAKDGSGSAFPPYELEAGDGGLLPPLGVGVPEVAGPPAAEPTVAAFGSAGDLLAVGYDNGVVLVWDYAARDLMHTLKAHAGEVRGIVWDDAGKVFATCGDDGTAHLFDAQSGQLVRDFPGHEGAVTSIALAGEGRFLATGADDGRVRLWDASSGRLLGRHDEHLGPVRALGFQPGGSSVVSAGDDATIEVWDVTEELRAKALDEARVADVHALYGHARMDDRGVEALTFVGDGSLFLTGGADGSLRAWDAEVGGPVTNIIDRRFTAPDADQRLSQVTAVDFHPDGVLCLTGHANGSIAVWDTWSGELVDILRGHEHVVTSATWSADGTTILSASIDKTAILWDVAAHRERRTFRSHKSMIRCAAMAEDGSFIVTASGDKTAKIWDTVTGEELRSLEGHGGWVNAVAITPDEAQIWTGSRDGTLRLWSRATGEELSSIDVGTEVWRLALSPEGTIPPMLAAGLSDGRLLVLNALTGKELVARHVTVNDELISALEFNGSGTRLVVGSVDGLLRIFNPRTGDQLLSLRLHTGGISGVSFSPDGARLLSASDTSTQGSTIGWGERAVLVWETGSSVERRDSWRRAADLRTKAAPTVAYLYSTLFLQSKVLARLDQMTMLPNDVRLSAKRLARLRDDDPHRLTEESWSVVRQRGATELELELAQGRAEAAVALDPESCFSLVVLGAAQVRRGLFSQALLSLEAAQRLGADNSREEVAVQCFLALAHGSLGHASEAEVCRERLDALAAGLGSEEEGATLQALIAEARVALQELGTGQAGGFPAGG